MTPHCDGHGSIARAITGLGPDTPMETNASGGRQSRTSYDFTLLDPAAMFRLAEVMRYGAEKYGPDNWRLISTRESVNHCIGHLYAWLAGDTSDDHLGHAFARAHIALAVALQSPMPRCSAAPARDELRAHLAGRPGGGLAARLGGDAHCPRRPHNYATTT